jgi:hypothetical protein
MQVDSAGVTPNVDLFRPADGKLPGHWMQWEAPDRVNALLVDFLAD